MKQHPSAIISPEAQIDDDVTIGPFTIIEGPVRIASGTVIMSHVHISAHTEIGHGNIIHMGAVIGNTPQHLGFKDCVSYTRIGDRNIIREYVTIHRSWEAEKATIIGNENFLMALSHVAHDCQLGNHIVMANGALLGGYVTVEDNAFLSGNTVFHQFVRIGRLAIVSGLTGIGKDVPPFCIAAGRSKICGVNIVGLRRAGISQDKRNEIRNAYKTIYRSGLNVSSALGEIERGNPCEEVRHLVEFIKNSKRGICRAVSDEEDETDTRPKT